MSYKGAHIHLNDEPEHTSRRISDGRPPAFKPGAHFLSGASTAPAPQPTLPVRKDAPKIIAIAGYKRSGKNTTANVITALTGYVQIAFADILKGMVRTLLREQGYSAAEIEEWIEGDKKEAHCRGLGNATPRHAMQTLGTEWGRRLIDPDIWVDATLRKAHDLIEKGAPGVLITDCRFLNEAAAVDDEGGAVLFVDRPSALPEPGLQVHASEAEIEDIRETRPCTLLRNHTTQSDFEREVAGWAWQAFISQPAENAA